MRVYLARHGDAEPGGSDDRRHLTELGRRDVEGVARRLAALRALPSVIRHSGKVRARETAEIFGHILGVRVEEQPLHELSPEADPAALQRWIEARREDLFLVTHLPLVDRAFSALAGGRGESPVFTTGSVAALTRDDEGQWKLLWFVEPNL